MTMLGPVWSDLKPETARSMLRVLVRMLQVGASYLQLLHTPASARGAHCPCLSAVPSRQLADLSVQTQNLQRNALQLVLPCFQAIIAYRARLDHISTCCCASLRKEVLQLVLPCFQGACLQNHK